MARHYIACAVCRFCRQVENMPIEDGPLFQCRRRSPEAGNMAARARWPIVDLDGGGCGDGRPRRRSIPIDIGGPADG